MRRLWGSSRRRVMLIQPAREFLLFPNRKKCDPRPMFAGNSAPVTPQTAVCYILYYTPGSLRRAAPMLGVRPPRLCLCGSEAVLRYAPLRRGPVKNLFSVIGRQSLLGGPSCRGLDEHRCDLGNSAAQHPGIGSIGEVVPRRIKVCPVLERRA